MVTAQSDPGDELGAALGALMPQVQIFAAVARHEHITRAAEELGVSQPGVSRAVARLESALGVALLHRSGRALRLTRAGRMLLRGAERALEEMVGGLLEVAGESDRMRRRVSLAFLPSLGTTVVPDLVRRYRDRCDDIQFDLMQDTHTVLMESLRTGESDLAITAPCPDGDEFDYRVLGEEEIRLVVPHDHPLATRAEGVALAEVAGEPFAGPPRGYGLSEAIGAWCEGAGFTPRVVFEGGDPATQRGFVGAGLGVALLPPARPSPPRGVVELPVTKPRTTRSIAAVWRRGDSRPAVASFRRFICSIDGIAL